MRATILGLAAATLFAGAAMAQGTTTIITQDPPAVVTTPAPGAVIVDRADTPPVTGSVATPPGCASTVTRQDNPDGTATTVRQERCLRD